MSPFPRIIHQTWKTDRIPERFAAWVHSWKRHHPRWRHILWTDRSGREFVKTRYPDRLMLYDSYDQAIKRADLLRYLLMHGIGGIYADLDVECLAPMDPLLRDGAFCLLGQEPELHAKRLYGRVRLVSNAVLASVPGHRFWSHVFAVMSATSAEKDVLDATGPRMLDRALANYPHDDIFLLPADVWNPLVDVACASLKLSASEQAFYRRMVADRTFPAASQAVHHWAGTWYSGGVAGALGRLWRRMTWRILRR